MSLIRTATPTDVPAILGMIHDLAVYEKEPDAVKNTEEMLSRNLFGDNPQVFAHVVEDETPAPGGARILGYAIWFLNYSTWEGTHGIYLEDLYVRPEARGGGHGKALLRTLAQIAVDRGYARVEWSVLDWNEPAINFYKGIGATAMDGWHVRRLSGKELGALGGLQDAGSRTTFDGTALP